MLTIDQQIFELRAELAHCKLTRQERAQAQAELQHLIAAKAEADRAYDAAPPG